MSDGYGTRLVETEALAAALTGDTDAVAAIVATMFPNERQTLRKALSILDVAIGEFSTGDPAP